MKVRIERGAGDRWPRAMVVDDAGVPLLDITHILNRLSVDIEVSGEVHAELGIADPFMEVDLVAELVTLDEQTRQRLADAQGAGPTT